MHVCMYIYIHTSKGDTWKACMPIVTCLHLINDMEIFFIPILERFSGDAFSRGKTEDSLMQDED